MIEKLSRNTQPALQPVNDIEVKQVSNSSLDNGIPLFYVNAGVQDVIRVELLFMNAPFDHANPLLHSSAGRLMNEGTTRHTALQLAERIDYYGAFYETEQSADYSSVVIHTLRKHLEDVVNIVFEILTEATYPESELSVFIQNSKQRLAVENEKVGSVARRKFSEIIFGPGHEYGYFITAPDYDKLSQAELTSFQRAHFVSNHCALIASGRVDDGAIQILNKVFGNPGWSRGNGILNQPDAFATGGEKINYIERKNAIQSAIRIGRPLFNKTHPDYAGMQFLNTVLGGYFGSRLMANIREDKGYTYGIGSAAASMLHGGYFFISSEVGADVCQKALDEIYKEMEILKREPVPADEMEMVRNFMLGSFLKSMDGAFQLADRWKGIMIYNLGYDYYRRFIDTIKEAKPEDLMVLAQKYFRREEMCELVVGKK